MPNHLNYWQLWRFDTKIIDFQKHNRSAAKKKAHARAKKLACTRRIFFLEKDIGETGDASMPMFTLSESSLLQNVDANSKRHKCGQIKRNKAKKK